MPTKVPTFTSALEQFWPDALLAATNDSYDLNPGLLCASRSSYFTDFIVIFTAAKEVMLSLCLFACSFVC